MSKESHRAREKRAKEQASPLVTVPLDKLLFDASNPRIVELAGISPTQAKIRDILLGPDMQARDLVPSFVENGYLPYEPLIIRPEVRGKHVVLEGNRRLAALQSMSQSADPSERDAVERHQLRSVPCIVFTGDTGRELAYLGLRHLSKTKDWTASAKAAFVERVLKSGRTLEEAGRLTNTTSHNLRLLLLTRRLIERAGELGLDPATTSTEGEIIFWHLGDAVRRTNTKQYLKLEESDDPLRQPQLDETKFENLIGWLYGNTKTRTSKLISSIREIPELDRCLSHRRPIQVLESGGTLADAVEELQSAGASVLGHLERAKKSVQRATGQLSDVDAEGKAPLQAPFKELESAVSAFRSALKG